MASEKEKIKKPAANSKGRMIAVITAIFMIFMIVLGYYKFHSTSALSEGGGSFSGGPGSIQSIPGAINPTAQYAKLQEEQNVQKAVSAEKKGSSSIPTIVRSQAFGEGVEAVGPQGGKGGLGFTEIERLNLGGMQQSLWLQDLVAGDCSTASVKKAVSLGAGLQDLRKACSCTQLKANGYVLKELDTLCSCPDLKAAGFNATQLKQDGYSASKLAHCGFNACELQAAGFSAKQLKAAGMSDGELKGAGYSKSEIASVGGVPNGVSDSAIRAAGCSPIALRKLRNEGVTAAAIRRISGCSLEQLKAAGYSAKELEAAGFTPAELKNAGIIPAGLSALDIEAAGCDPRKLHSLMEKGVSAKQIEELNHCTAGELSAAGASLGDLMNAGFSKNQAEAAEAMAEKDADRALRDLTNCNVEALKAARKAGVSATDIAEKLHCSAAALKAAGYSDAEVNKAEAVAHALQNLTNCDVNSLKAAKEAGVSAKAIIEKLHCSAAALKAAGYSDAAIKAAEDAAIADAAHALRNLADCNVDSLKAAREAGVSATDIVEKLHCSAAALKAAGYSDAEIKQAEAAVGALQNLTNCDASSLKAAREAGVSAKAIIEKLHCSAAALKAAGYSDAEIKAAEAAAKEAARALRNLTNCNVDSLRAAREAGVSATDIAEKLHCSAAALKAAGYSDAEVTKAEAAARALQNLTNCDINSLKAAREAGVSAKAIIEKLHCSAAALKAAGYSDAAIKAAEEAALADAAHALRELANCNVDSLKAAREAGVSAADIMEKLHCSVAALKAAGFSDADIKKAESAPLALQNLTNCDVRSLQAAREAGVSAKSIIEKLHCSAAALKAAGFSDAAINAAEAEAAKDAARALRELTSCNVDALKAARKAGVSATDIEEKLHCSPAALKAAGYSDADINKALEAARALQNLTNCDVNSLKAARQAGVSATAIVAKLHCSPEALEAAGFSGADIKNAEHAEAAALALHNLTNCSVDALTTARQEGVSAESILEKLHCSAGALEAAGFSPEAVKDAEEAAAEIAARALQNLTNCDVDSLRAARQAGVTAEDILKKLHCSPAALKAAGFTAADLLKAGIPADKLVAIGFSAEEVAAAEGVSHKGVPLAPPQADCSVSALKRERAQGVSAATIRDKMGCSLEALKAAGYTAKELREAGFTAAELKGIGFTASELKNAGYSAGDLAAAGFTAQQLKNAGFSLNDLAQAGFDAKDLRQAGFSASEMRAAGYSADELKKAGFTPKQLQEAGYSESELQRIGINPKEAELNSALESAVPKNKIPVAGGASALGAPSSPFPSKAQDNQKQLKEVLQRQKEQLAAQQYQQQIQSRLGVLTSAAMQAMQGWKAGYTQSYVGGNAGNEKAGKAEAGGKEGGGFGKAGGASASEKPSGPPSIRAGEVMFAVLDTSVDSDEPGPILATIVAGRFKGAKLIGSFHLPPNADKMVIDFNTLSPSGAERTTSISAYAIDPNTARTALASSVNHHYLTRYGSLFAATWLEGFGNAVQSANTTITVGGTGVAQATTIQNGVGRSTLENAVIGLATLGKTWGQVAMEKVNTPVTVKLCSGTGIGVLFSQDVDV